MTDKWIVIVWGQVEVTKFGSIEREYVLDGNDLLATFVMADDEYEAIRKAAADHGDGWYAATPVPELARRVTVETTTSIEEVE